MSRRITVTMNTMSLAFSPDGKHLAAGLGEGGLRVYERSKAWAEVFRDEDYNSAIYGIAFAADGRLATSSLDRKIRLYNSSFRRLRRRNPLWVEADRSDWHSAPKGQYWQWVTMTFRP